MTFSEDERRQLAAMRMARADLALADASTFDRRCDADYTDVAAFTAEQVAAMFDQAGRFVAEVKSLLQAT
ncbi:MAG: hypothetical protein KKE86_12200 [Planctomycetes bacterium]|nr:hypothetical protein [Planctomycetota bacterium]MBU4400084.1 hypothetical protein [Planctomycetota bacterium]MCG2684750.1 hypothetical protein [Planctomycetales bacterium]